MAKSSWLENTHRALGAVWGTSGGRNIPLHYGDPDQEVIRVRKTGGVVDRSFMGKLEVKGEDRIEFLQGMVTNHVKLVTPEKGVHSLIVTVKGKVVSDFTLCEIKNAFMMILEPDLLSPTQALLDRYIIASQVEMADITERFGLVSIHGPNTHKLMEKTFGLPAQEKEDYSVEQVTWKNRLIWCIHRRELGERGFDLITEIDGLEPVWEELVKEGERFEIFPFGNMAYDVLRIEAGTPRFGFELDETVFPLEAGVDDAVHYDKGCYLGQETVTRMKFRGHPNRGRVGLDIQGNLLPSFKSPILHDGKSVGWVTSCAYSPVLRKNIGMGYVRMECTSPGTPLKIESGDQEIGATVRPLPFVGEKNKEEK